MFELQDDLVPRIVSTVADMNGVLPHSIERAVTRPFASATDALRVLAQVSAIRRSTAPESLAQARVDSKLR